MLLSDRVSMADPGASSDQDTLRAAAPFPFLPEAEIAALLQSSPKRSVGAGEVLLRAGAQLTELWIPLRGRLRRVAGDDPSGPGEVVTLGQPLALDNLLGGSPCASSVVADEPSEYARLLADLTGPDGQSKMRGGSMLALETGDAGDHAALLAQPRLAASDRT